MNNPFETIDSRLSTIESLLLDIKHHRRESNSFRHSEKDEILNVKQASECLNLAIPTIYSLVSKRALTSYKRGKKLYFKKSELMQWIQSGRRTPVSEIQNRAKNYTKAA